MAGNKTISAFPEGDNMMKWAAKIIGPTGTVSALLCSYIFTACSFVQSFVVYITTTLLSFAHRFTLNKNMN